MKNTFTISNNLEVSLIENMQDFLKLEVFWNDLLKEGYANNPFLTFEWQKNWWENFGDNNRLYILILYQNDKVTPIAIAPLMITKIGPFRIMQFIGTGLSDYLDFIIGGQIDEVIKAMFTFLKNRREDWDLIFLSDILPIEGNIEHMSKTPKQLGFKECHRVYTISPYLPIRGDWGQFWNSKNSKFRNNLKRREKLVQKDGYRPNICKTDLNGGDKQGFNDMVEIERKSWKCDAGTAKIQQEWQKKFYKSFLESFMDKGWLNLWLGYLNNRPVAYQMNFDYNSKIWFYNCAQDEDFSKYGMGSMLIHHAMKDAFSNKKTECDFMRGPEPYKSDWASENRESYQFIYYKARPVSLFGYLILYRLRWYLAKFAGLQKARLYLKKVSHGFAKFRWKHVQAKAYNDKEENTN